MKLSNSWLFVLTLLSPFSIGCIHLEQGLPLDSDLVDCREGYAIGYSFEMKSAKWVAYRLEAQVNDGVDRTNDFREDPEIPAEYQTSPDDYDEPVYDQGHLANSESIDQTLSAMSETFLMSNIIPQLPRHNRGIWKGLENRERKWANARNVVYVFAGPLYEGVVEHIGDNNVPVPSHMWKVVYDPNAQEAIAYLIDHAPLYTRDLDNYLVSIDEVERRTGLDLLSNVRDPLSDQIESYVAPKQW